MVHITKELISAVDFAVAVSDVAVADSYFGKYISLLWRRN